MTNTKKNNLDKLTIILDDKSSKADKKNTALVDKKIKKIEQLTKQVKTIKDQIINIKHIYSTHIEKEEQVLFLNKEKLIVKLYERFQQKSFSKWQKDFIENKLLNEIDFLHENDAMTPTVSEIHKKMMLHEEENISDEEKELMNEIAKDMFKGMGIDIDEDDFDFTNKEFRDNFQENFNQQNFDNQQEDFSEDKKEKVRTTDKDFQKLYRVLVKKVHPDLVKDPQEKEQRENLMKKLSQAWEDRNYYQLLILKNEIDADGSTDVLLNKKQTQAMIFQLDQEIIELEFIKHQLKTHEPESAFYYQNFFAKSKKGILKKIEDYKKQIIEDSNSIKNEIKDLKTQKSTKEFLNTIKNQKDIFNDLLMDDFDLFDDF